MKRIVVLTLLLPVAALWAALALPGTGHATPWSELVVFGDSLSDMGNAAPATIGLVFGGALLLLMLRSRSSNRP